MNENAGINDDTADTPNPYDEIHQPFRNKSDWNPNPPNGTLDIFKREFKTNLLESQNAKPIKPNLTKEEWKGLLELRKNPNIVIKKADKGAAVVIMDTTDYLREGYRQLNDPNFYTKLEHDPAKTISDKICKVLTEIKNCKLITEKNFDFLNIKEPKAGRFYLIPKIHKKQVPGRPISISIGYPTCSISKFVDAHIKDYVPKAKSYVRDTQN